jgi:hypothetical protein
VKIDQGVGLVTGGASGLGLATVRALPTEGAGVVILDLTSSDGKAIAEDLGDRAVFAPADVTDTDAVLAAVDTASALRTLRVAVNCAGRGGPARTVGKDGPARLDASSSIISTNLIGTFNVIRLAAARIAEAAEIDGERGVIVNTASVAAFDGQIGQGPYSASKGGIVGDDPADRPRPGEPQGPRGHHRPGAVPHPAVRTPGRGQDRGARAAGPASVPARASSRIRFAGRAHRHESDAERRDDQARRRDPDGAALTTLSMSCPGSELTRE